MENKLLQISWYIMIVCTEGNLRPNNPDTHQKLGNNISWWPFQIPRCATKILENIMVQEKLIEDMMYDM